MNGHNGIIACQRTATVAAGATIADALGTAGLQQAGDAPTHTHTVRIHTIQVGGNRWTLLMPLVQQACSQQAKVVVGPAHLADSSKAISATIGAKAPLGCTADSEASSACCA